MTDLIERLNERALKWLTNEDDFKIDYGEEDAKLDHEAATALAAREAEIERHAEYGREMVATNTRLLRQRDTAMQAFQSIIDQPGTSLMVAKAIAKRAIDALKESTNEAPGDPDIPDGEWPNVDEESTP